MHGEHSLTPELTAVPTPGHTPGHVSILITSQGARALRPSACSSLIRPCTLTVSSTQSTLVSFTDMRPPRSQPSPKWSCISCDTKHVDIIPCTTIVGKPSFFACSRSV